MPPSAKTIKNFKGVLNFFVTVQRFSRFRIWECRFRIERNSSILGLGCLDFGFGISEHIFGKRYSAIVSGSTTGAKFMPLQKGVCSNDLLGERY